MDNYHNDPDFLILFRSSFVDVLGYVPATESHFEICKTTHLKLVKLNVAKSNIIIVNYKIQGSVINFLENEAGQNFDTTRRHVASAIIQDTRCADASRK